MTSATVLLLPEKTAGIQVQSENISIQTRPTHSNNPVSSRIPPYPKPLPCLPNTNSTSGGIYTPKTAGTTSKDSRAQNATSAAKEQHSSSPIMGDLVIDAQPGTKAIFLALQTWSAATRTIRVVCAESLRGSIVMPLGLFGILV